MADLDKLAKLVAECNAPQPPLEAAEQLGGWVKGLLNDKLHGSRTVFAQPWAVVRAMARAYPTLLHKDVDTAAAQGGNDPAQCLDAWVPQALHSGSLPTLLTKLHSQPQVLSAYGVLARLRDQPTVQGAAQLLQQVQGRVLVQAATGTSGATGCGAGSAPTPSGQPAAASLDAPNAGTATLLDAPEQAATSSCDNPAQQPPTAGAQPMEGPSAAVPTASWPVAALEAPAPKGAEGAGAGPGGGGDAAAAQAAVAVGGATAAPAMPAALTQLPQPLAIAAASAATAIAAAAPEAHIETEEDVLARRRAKEAVQHARQANSGIISLFQRTGRKGAPPDASASSSGNAYHTPAHGAGRLDEQAGAKPAAEGGVPVSGEHRAGARAGADAAAAPAAADAASSSVASGSRMSASGGSRAASSDGSGQCSKGAAKGVAEAAPEGRTGQGWAALWWPGTGKQQRAAPSAPPGAATSAEQEHPRARLSLSLSPDDAERPITLQISAMQQMQSSLQAAAAAQGGEQNPAEPVATAAPAPAELPGTAEAGTSRVAMDKAPPASTTVSAATAPAASGAAKPSSGGASSSIGGWVFGAVSAASKVATDYNTAMSAVNALNSHIASAATAAASSWVRAPAGAQRSVGAAASGTPAAAAGGGGGGGAAAASSADGAPGEDVFSDDDASLFHLADVAEVLGGSYGERPMSPPASGSSPLSGGGGSSSSLAQPQAAAVDTQPQALAPTGHEVAAPQAGSSDGAALDESTTATHGDDTVGPSDIGCSCSEGLAGSGGSGSSGSLEEEALSADDQADMLDWPPFLQRAISHAACAHGGAAGALPAVTLGAVASVAATQLPCTVTHGSPSQQAASPVEDVGAVAGSTQQQRCRYRLLGMAVCEASIAQGDGDRGSSGNSAGGAYVHYHIGVRAVHVPEGTSGSGAEAHAQDATTVDVLEWQVKRRFSHFQRFRHALRRELRHARQRQPHAEAAGPDAEGASSKLPPVACGHLPDCWAQIRAGYAVQAAATEAPASSASLESSQKGDSGHCNGSKGVQAAGAAAADDAMAACALSPELISERVALLDRCMHELLLQGGDLLACSALARFLGLPLGHELMPGPPSEPPPSIVVQPSAAADTVGGSGLTRGSLLSSLLGSSHHDSAPSAAPDHSKQKQKPEKKPASKQEPQPKKANTAVAAPTASPPSDGATTGGAAPPLPASDSASASVSSAAVPERVASGSSIRLMLDLPRPTTTQQLWDAQGGACAGCKGVLSRPATKGGSYLGLRWGAKPGPALQRCHYTGLLYCSDCHKEQAEVTPASVLHHWDFTPRPVCAMAAEYLAAIHEQPLLCVSAVNPQLYNRAPTLARAHDLRVQISRDLTAAAAAGDGPAGRAAALRAFAGPGRAHLLDGLDFWSMRDLVDISKGALAQLPRWLEGMASQAEKLVRAQQEGAAAGAAASSEPQARTGV